MLSPAKPGEHPAWLMSCTTPILASGPPGHVPEKAGHGRPKYAARAEAR